MERRLALEEHVRTIVSRYKGRIKLYDAVNHPVKNKNDNFMGTGWDTVEGIVNVFSWAKEEDPNALFLINEGVIKAKEGRGEYIQIIKKALADGAPIDGIGFMAHFGWGSSKLPEDENIDKIIRDISKIGLPIYITEFDVSYDNRIDPNLPFEGYDNWWDYQAYTYKPVQPFHGGFGPPAWFAD